MSQYRPPFANMRKICKSLNGQHVLVPGNATVDPNEKGNPVDGSAMPEEVLRALGKDMDGNPLPKPEEAPEPEVVAPAPVPELPVVAPQGTKTPEAVRSSLGFDPVPSEEEILLEDEDVEIAEDPDPEPVSEPTWDRSMRKAELIEVARANGFDVSDESHTKAMIVDLLRDNNVR